MKFNNKETYLAYRSNWKSEYKELSQQIREKKWMLKEYNRACNIAYPSTNSGHDFYLRYWSRIELELKGNEKYCELVKKYGKNGFYYIDLQKKATAMLFELKESKQEAQRQYLATKETELVLA